MADGVYGWNDWGQHEAMFTKYRRGPLTAEIADAPFSFLLGCHQRFGTNNEFKFINAPCKARLVVNLLAQLGSPWIQQEWFPHSVLQLRNVRFKTTPQLAAFLSIPTDDAID